MANTEVYRFDYVFGEELDETIVPEGRLSDDRFKTITVPLNAGEDGPDLVMLSVREFSELPGEDRILLGVSLGESFSGTDDSLYQPWLARIYNKGTPPDYVTAQEDVVELAIRLKKMKLLDNGGSRFRLTDTSREYLQDRFSIVTSSNAQETQNEKTKYEDFTAKEMVRPRILEYIGDTIVQRSGGDVRGWLVPIDNTAGIMYGLFHEMNNTIFSSEEEGKKQADYMNKLIGTLERKYGMIKTKKIPIAGTKRSNTITANLQLSERGIAWYEDHVERQVETGSLEATQEGRQKTAATG